MYDYPYGYGWMDGEGQIGQRRPDQQPQRPPAQQPRLAPQTLRQYVGRVIRVIIRGVYSYPVYVYVCQVNRWGDATLIACAGGIPRPIIVSSRQVTIV